MRTPLHLSARREVLGFNLIIVLAAACTFDASRLRASASSAADVPIALAPDAVLSDAQGNAAVVRDAPAGTPDASGGTGGSNTPVATGGVGGSDGPTEIGGAKPDDGPIATGGANGNDVPMASGGTDTGGSAGASGTAGSTGDVEATAGSGGSASGGAGGGTSPTGGGGGEDSSSAGGNMGSGGQTDTGDPDGGIVVDAAGGAASTGGTLTGGASPTGGITETGGSVDGGNTGSGGVQATGGTSQAGTLATGGSFATGGTTATAGSGGTTPSGGAGGSAHTGVWRIMLLGDAMTANSCYPQLLSQEFRSQGRTNFQFVGMSQISRSCNGAPAVATEALAGCYVTNLVTNNPAASGTGSLSQLQRWAAENPDIVLMDLGSGDAHAGQSTASILSALLFVTNQFRSQNPDVIFFISKVTPVSTSSWESSVVDLNAQITDAWAASNSTAMSPVFIIDQWTGFSASTDTSDGLLPNVSGSQKMADKAYAAVSAYNYF